MQKVLNKWGVSGSLTPSAIRVAILNDIKLGLSSKNLLKKMTLFTKRLFHQPQERLINNTMALVGVIMI